MHKHAYTYVSEHMHAFLCTYMFFHTRRHTHTHTNTPQRHVADAHMLVMVSINRRPAVNIFSIITFSYKSYEYNKFVYIFILSAKKIK